MNVQPWEPVSYRWMLNIPTGHDAVNNIEWPWSWDGMDDEEAVKGDLGSDAMLVYLANDQRVIVRALSDERKAARAAMKEATQ